MNPIKNFKKNISSASGDKVQKRFDAARKSVRSSFSSKKNKRASNDVWSYGLYR